MVKSLKKSKIKKEDQKILLKRIISSVLAVACILNLGISIVGYSNAAITTQLGSNLALGSPVLNKDAVSDDWNKYEMLVWGIFLSNFCTPFIDSYESTFNLGSTSGSEGSGVKALSFATGGDVANTQTIQDLTTYAINNQAAAVKPIKVSYNVYEYGVWLAENAFSAATADDEYQDNSGNNTSGNNTSGGNTSGNNTSGNNTSGGNTSGGNTSGGNTSGNNSYIQSSTSRNATLRDLFLAYEDASKKDYTTSWTDFKRFEDVDWLGNIGEWTAVSASGGAAAGATIGALAGSPAGGVGAAPGAAVGVSVGALIGAAGGAAGGVVDSFTMSLDNSVIQNTNYPDMAAVTHGNIPTFAIEVNSKYEIIFDYRNTYDLEMFSGALAKALSSDFNSKVVELLNNTDLSTLPLYFDTYGNICAYDGSQYIVIIPASANQYLTKEKSINMLNSLIFNAGTSASSEDGMLNLAGQAKNTNRTISNALSSDNSMASGILAFSNGEYTNHNGMAIFYDTDTLVAQSRSTYADELEVDAGLLYKTFFDLDINDETNSVPFKIEPLNMSESLYKKIGLKDEIQEMVKDTIESTSSLTNFLLNSTGGVPRLTYLIDYTKKTTDPNSTIELFEESFVIPVQFLPGVSDNGKKNQWAVYRTFLNFLYQCYLGNVNGVSSNTIASILSSNKTQTGLADAIILDDVTKDTASNITKQFWINNGGNLFKVSDQSGLGRIKMGSWGNCSSAMELLALHDINNNKGVNGGSAISTAYDWNNSTWFFDTKDGKYLAKTLFGRSVKVYKTSSVLEQVSQILSLRDGTDFSVYSTNIYLTYLKWYEIGKDKLTGDPTSNLNESLFDAEALPDDISTVTGGIQTKEDMENEILRYTYLMLNPTSTEGQNYRNQIMMSNLQSSIYEQYQRIVYGSASSYNYDLMTTRNNTGFLAVENYSDNFLTSWFMRDYSTYAVYLIGIGLVIVVLIGVLKQRKATWFFCAIILVVNVVLVLPSTGEIVPYIANNTVQSIFDDKMTYWSISEQIANADTEKQLLKQQESLGASTSGLSESEASQVYSLVQSIKSIYLDRFISIKQDISNKVTSTDNTAWEDAQQYKSTRWLLPMILRQFTNTEGTADYVYVALSDKTEDISNMYWYYIPEDATFSQTVNGMALATDDIATYDKSNGINTSIGRSVAWPNFTDLSTESFDNHTYRSISYNRNSNLPHTYFYLIDQDGLLSYDFSSVDISNYNNVDDWAEAYANLLLINSNETTYRQISADIQSKAGSYDRYDRGTIDQIYGFLWNTESPLHYFYEVVKDSFQPGVSLGAIVGDLEGEYIKDANGNEYRKAMVIDDNSQAVRDVLDLENMFKNVIPYMYSIQLATGGVDGTSGILGANNIVDYDIYKDNLESWLFRSNWVTKLIGNSEYSTPATIYYYDGSGNRIKSTVANQMMPDCYTSAGREMVFSDAQRIQMGLTEADLSLMELKCININKEVAKAWTLMLNYIGEDGLTREIVLRQMAIDATMEFNNQLTSANTLRDSLKMYPDALDLRSISFDSIMCMLMLNVTHNNSFIYGDTMSAVISDFDIITTILLLIVAYLCALVIPFIRCIALGLMFYLGYASVIRSLFRDNKEKINTSLGYAACHILYLVINIIYLYCFKMLLAMTTSEDVLTIPTAEINTGNPVWCLVVILIIDALFIIASYKMIVFCIKNYKDMGMAVIKNGIEMVSMNISTTFEKLSGKLSEFASTGKISDSNGSSRSSGKYDGASTSNNYSQSYADIESANTERTDKSSSNKTTNSKDSTYENSEYSVDYDDNYYYNNSGPGYDEDGAEYIDDKIDKGKKAREKADKDKRTNKDTKKDKESK